MFLFLLSNVYSQKVGLVLSGGGAKGIAHIGLIRALEENNIPIDCISGTSIGAIIGGLYASGYSPDEIEQLIKSAEFILWSSGIIEEEQTYYFKKLDINASWIELKFTDDSLLKPILPTNIVPNHQMDLGFFKIFSSAAAACNYNFDSLMVPFRCVATDIYNKKEFIMAAGELSSAIRASSTYPLYFKPIKIDNTLLFDGGMINNFPVEILDKAFNPDVIIGCKVASNSPPPEEDNISTQLENIFTAQTNYSVPPGKGVLIEPKLMDVNTFDFYRYDTLEKQGYDATMARLDEIKEMVVRRVTIQELQEKRRHFKAKEQKLLFGNIYISGLNSTQRAYTINSIRSNKEIFTIDDFEDAYFKLLADQIISSIYPRALFNRKTGYFDLYLSIKRDKRFEASLGGNISSSSVNQAYAGVEFKHLSNNSYNVWANTYFGRFYSSASIRGRADFPLLFIGSKVLNLPFYIDLGITFNHWDYYKSNTDLFFEDSRPSFVIIDESNLRAEIGFPLTDHGRITIGGAIARMTDEYYQTNKFSKNDTSDVTDFNYSVCHFTTEQNTLNYRQFPNAGRFISMKVMYIQGNEKHVPGSTSLDDTTRYNSHRWLQLNITFDRYFKINRKFTLGIYLQGVFSQQDFFSDYPSTIHAAPAFQPTPFSKTMLIENFRAYNFIGGGIKSVVNVFRKFDLRIETYIFQPYQKILPENQQADYGKILNARHYLSSIILVYQTLAGPASLSVSYYDKSDSRVYFQFNFGYILFNKKGMD